MKPNPVFRIFSFSPDPRDGNLWNAVVFYKKTIFTKQSIFSVPYLNGSLPKR